MCHMHLEIDDQFNLKKQARTRAERNQIASKQSIILELFLYRTKLAPSNIIKKKKLNYFFLLFANNFD
ncbi:hypothetical protein BpHYR1_028870 [Brachionus plicatilis]|uniref:Uncharacterized protein n=1 Tax=Brachionus plicatilis TaxID=10195 RepID=A0A3M7T6U8_BRAPC|nr:hypothetical protein BpHYR1_028870 [Brachionus plicatilis]